MGGKNFRPHLVRVDSNLEVRGEERWGGEEEGRGGGRKENILRETRRREKSVKCILFLLLCFLSMDSPPQR